jgi:transcription initiation factor IIE alpha subunit
MKKSKLSQSIMAVFSNKPTECFTIHGIAQELGKTIDRTSSTRVSICRCLNRMYREGIVDYEYRKTIPNKCARKYWKLGMKNKKEEAKTLPTNIQHSLQRSLPNRVRTELYVRPKLHVSSLPSLKKKLHKN